MTKVPFLARKSRISKTLFAVLFCLVTSAYSSFSSAEQYELQGLAVVQFDDCTGLYLINHNVQADTIILFSTFNVLPVKVFFFDMCNGALFELPRETDPSLVTKTLDAQFVGNDFDIQFASFEAFSFVGWAQETSIEVTLTGTLDRSNKVVNNGDVFVELFFNGEPMNLNAISSFAIWNQ